MSQTRKVLYAILGIYVAAIALAIRLDSSGPALYWQPRRGRQGSTFKIVKFRTMFTGAEQRRSEVLHMNEVDGPLFKIKGVDPRVTRIGSFLRRTSLDELPQLWNVLKGEMSLVGPRPFVIYEADLITGWAARRRRRQAMRISRKNLTQAFGSLKCDANSRFVSRGCQ
jgi:lipopolysaccharide/colanic/teichoic acid biosynthesis glycosyltransferase